MSRIFAKTHTALLVGIVFLLTALASVESHAYSNPVFAPSHDVGDPSIIYHDGRFYMYPSAIYDGYYCWSSTNLQTWTSHGRVFDPNTSTNGKWMFWAPDVKRIGSYFYMACSCSPVVGDASQQRVFLARSSSPTGPFLDYSTPLSFEQCQCYDGSLFLDDNGEVYLLYTKSPTCPPAGAWEIYCVKLDPTLSFAVGSPVKLLSQVAEWEKDTYFPHEHAVDGHSAATTTRWASAVSSQPESISIDLEETRSIDTVQVWWDPARAKSFEVSLAATATSTPTVVANVVNNQQSYNVLSFAPMQARFITLKMTERTAPYSHYSLYEVEALSGGAAVSRRKRTSASSLYRDSSVYHREGAALYRRNGIYYLFHSGDIVQGPNYSVGVSVATNVFGPYYPVDTNPIVKKVQMNGVCGPAHNCIFSFPWSDDLFVGYHANYDAWQDPEAVFHRSIYVDRLRFDTEGIPYVVGPLKGAWFGPQPDAIGGSNLSLGKPTTASSVYGSWSPGSAATDSDLAISRWASAPSGGAEWLEVDLLDYREIKGFRALWDPAYGRTFNVSAQGQWGGSIAESVNNSQGALRVEQAFSGERRVFGKKARLTATQQAPGFLHFSLYDLSLFGDGGPLSVLSAGKPIVASSVYAGWAGATNANDGNETTRWASATTGGVESLTIDLGAVYELVGAELLFDPAFASKYLVEGSLNGVYWEELTPEITNNSSAAIAGFYKEAVARHVRVKMIAPTGGYQHYSVFEARILGYPSALVDAAPGSSVSASSIYGGWAGAGNAVDGNEATRWASAPSGGEQWLAFDLQTTRELRGFGVRWDPAFASRYVVECSGNGIDYLPVCIRRVSTQSAADFVGLTAPVRARWYRLRCIQPASGYLHVSAWTVNLLCTP